VQFPVTDADTPGDLTAESIDVDEPDGARPQHHRLRRARPGAVRAPHDRIPELLPERRSGHRAGDLPYHVNGRGWDDIGYNALIYRYRGIWEGREGCLEQAVIGAHTYGFNSWSTGVALIGDHKNGGAPTVETQAALVRYAAWKMDAHNVNPIGRSSIVSTGSTKRPAGRAVELRRVSGHRDASSSSCPGRSYFSLLDDTARRIDGAGGMRIFGGSAPPSSS
jgi:hypothetical protein